jgi:hypothetical protein
VLAVSGSSYFAALPFPALLFRSDPPVRGIIALLWGWWGFVTGDIPWLANPLYFLELLLVALGLNKLALLLCAVVIGLGARSVLVEQWYFNEAQGTPVTGLGTAFYLWMSSFVLLLLGAMVLLWLPKPVKTGFAPSG